MSWEIRLKFLDQWMDGNLAASESNLPFDGGGCCGERLGGFKNCCHRDDYRHSLRQQSFQLVTEMRQIETAFGRGGSEDRCKRNMARNCESAQRASMAPNLYFINLVNRIIRDCGSRAGMDEVS